MYRTFRFAILAATMIFCASAVAQTPPQRDPRKVREEQMAKQVFEKLLAVPAAAKPIKTYDAWPPEVSVLDPARDPSLAEMVGKYNAFANAPLCYPTVNITEPMFPDVIQGDEDRLALILGHELGHVLLGHVDCAQTRDLSRTAMLSFARDQEFAADAKGWELALAAGFSPRNGLKGLMRLRLVAGSYSSFEAMGANHPSWAERLERLDKAQASVWRMMSAFEDGAYFLNAENYLMAERCFQAVTKEFPNAYEAWANLGYALLMQYSDELRAEDLRQLGIGQVAAGAFYSEPITVISTARGINAQLWSEALAALEQADKLNPQLALVKGNIGLAYLLRPTGKDTEKAILHLQQAVNIIKADPALAAMPGQRADAALVAVVNNLAVAFEAAGRHQDAFNAAEIGMKYVSPDSDPGLLQLYALHYNAGMLLGGSPDPKQRSEGLAHLEIYLKQANASSAWWPLAYDRYVELCRNQGVPAMTQAQLQRAAPRRDLRRVTSLDLGPGRTISLGERLTELAATGEKWREVSTVASTRVRRLRAPDNSLDLLADDKILAIILRDPRGPAVPLRGIGSDVRTDQLRVSMTADDVDKILQAQAYRFESLGDTWVPYRFYPYLGVAIRLGANRTVDELVVMPATR